jgi:DNA-binding response OmpR family regulator
MAMTILVLGTDARLGDSLSGSLAATGLPVICVDSTPLALAQLTAGTIGLALVDAATRDLAEGALPAIRATAAGAHLPLVVLTDGPAQGRADWARDLGATAAIDRAAPADELLALIHQLTG